MLGRNGLATSVRCSLVPSVPGDEIKNNRQLKTVPFTFLHPLCNSQSNDWMIWEYFQPATVPRKTPERGKHSWEGSLYLDSFYNRNHITHRPSYDRRLPERVLLDGNGMENCSTRWTDWRGAGILCCLGGVRLIGWNSYRMLFQSRREGSHIGQEYFWTVYKVLLKEYVFVSSQGDGHRL